VTSAQTQICGHVCNDYKYTFYFENIKYKCTKQKILFFVFCILNTLAEMIVVTISNILYNVRVGIVSFDTTY